MFKNYFKIAIRNLWKERVFTSLNVLGLTVAFGVAILLAMYATFQLSFDKFHANGDNLYQVHMTWQIPKGTEVGTSQPTPFAEALKSEVPGVKRITRHFEDEALTIYKDKELGLDALFVDADFFEMFSFSMIQGQTSNLLKDSKSVVITKETARKLFKEENPIGKTISILINGAKEPFTVSAVSADMPDASSITYDIAIPFSKNPAFEETKERWNAQYHEVYIELDNQVSTKAFEENSRNFTNLQYKSAIEKLKRDGAQPNANGDFLQLGLLPVKDLRFVNYDKGYVEISRSKVNIVSGIALLILFIACVNFINMGIAKSSKRLREIGMRKALGAEKRQVFLQFWLESLVVFLFSTGLGILLSFLLKNSFQTIFRTSATLNVLFTPTILITALLLVLIISLIVGGYPAVLLNRLTTVQSLKGKLDSTGNNRLRNTLIVVQFGIAILLISGTFVLKGQLDYMRNKDLGYNKQQVFSFPLNGKKNSYDVVKLLREDLLNQTNILGVSGSDNNLGRGKDGSQYTSVWGFDYKGRSVRTNTLTVDYDYIKTLGLQLLKGRSFDASRESDAQAIIINESMARELSEENPLSVLIPVTDSLNYSVVGVVKDYHFKDISKTIEPLSLFLNREEGLKYAFVKVAASDMVNSVHLIEQAYKNIEPNAAFLGSFLDENVDRTFRREKNMAALITSGSVVAIILSCIGLFAMSMFITIQRTKEIGIRKVVGASVSAITVLLTKDFLKLIGIAFIIATPIAWWATSEWLQSYPYRMELNLWIFIAAGALALIIAVITISQRTIRAAIANPVKSLRTE
ncbi:ABC transporter permease [Winogradskyella flava]|uniref:ABC transporter permease n=1 Tax=Winogradskyella flava TaxID=1884876 RepID=A0A842ISD4_9FLAO|nr:ABC transporter permease [Winogradskyella flava]MBC2844726.1 ABC transporter permease [Winogradskyella flava]